MRGGYLHCGIIKAARKPKSPVKTAAKHRAPDQSHDRSLASRRFSRAVHEVQSLLHAHKPAPSLQSLVSHPQKPGSLQSSDSSRRFLTTCKLLCSGGIFCGKCSAGRGLLEGWAEPQRLCDGCVLKKAEFEQKASRIKAFETTHAPFLQKGKHLCFFVCSSAACCVLCSQQRKK